MNRLAISFFLPSVLACCVAARGDVGFLELWCPGAPGYAAQRIEGQFAGEPRSAGATQANTSPDDARFDDLSKRYWEIVKTRPQHGTAFDQWYRHYLDAGRLDDLTNLVETEAKAKAHDFAAQMIAGLVNERRGQEARAIEHYAAAERLAPDNYSAPYLRGMLLARQARFGDAVHALDRARQLDPPRPELLEIYKRIGRLQLRQGKVRDATDTWREISQKFPGDRQVIEELAELLTEEEQYDEAILLWDQVAALAKDDLYRRLTAQMEIAQLYARTGKTQDAMTLFEQARAQVDPDSWLARDVERRIEQVFQQAENSNGLVSYYEDRLERQPDDLNSLVRLASFLARSGKSSEALERYRAAVKLAPRRRDVREALVRELIRARQFAAALAECQELAKYNPDAADILLMLGQLQLDSASDTNRTEAELAAIETWKRVAAIRPNDPTLALRVAEACRQAATVSHGFPGAGPRGAGGIDEERAPRNPAATAFLETAEEYYREAIRRHPGAPQHHEDLGEFLHAIGRRADAVAAWARMTAPPGDTAENWHRLAELYARFDHLDEALNAGEQSLALDPDNFDYQVAQFQWLLKRQSFERALDYLTRLDRLATEPWLEEKAIQHRVEYHAAAVSADAEIRRLQSTIESAPSTVRDHWLLAALLAQKQRYSAAAKSLDLAIKQAPDDVRLVKAMAAILEQGGDMVSAVEQYRRLVDLEPRSRSTYLEKIARAELELGRGHRAREAADALIEAAPLSLVGYKLRAEIAFRLGDATGGIDTLRRAVRIAPRDLDVRLLLARALAERRSVDEALEHYWRAFEMVESLTERLAIVSAMSDFSASVGWMDRVLGQLRELRRRRDDAVGLTLCLVEALRKTGDFASARRELVGLLATRPGDLDVTHQLIALAEATKDWTSAVTYQQQIVERMPDRANLETLAKFYVLAGNEPEADAVWRRILTDTEDPLAWLGAVDRQLQRGELSAALQLAEMGIAKQPDDWRLQFRAALAQLGLGHTQEAKKQFISIVSQRSDEKLDSPSVAGSSSTAKATQSPWIVPASPSPFSGAMSQFRQRLRDVDDILIARNACTRSYAIQPQAPPGSPPPATPQASPIRLQQIQQLQQRQQQEAALQRQMELLKAQIVQTPSADQRQVSLAAQFQQVQQMLTQLRQRGPQFSSMPPDQRSAKIESAIALFLLAQRDGTDAMWVQEVAHDSRASSDLQRYQLLAYLAAGTGDQVRSAIKVTGDALPDDSLPHVARLWLYDPSAGFTTAQPIQPDEREALAQSVTWLGARYPQLRAELACTHGLVLLQAGELDDLIRRSADFIDSAEQPQELSVLADLVPRLGEPSLQARLLTRAAELSGKSDPAVMAPYLQYMLSKNYLFATDDEYLSAISGILERYVEIGGFSISTARTPQSSTSVAPVDSRTAFASCCLGVDFASLLQQVFAVYQSAGKANVLSDRLKRLAGQPDAAAGRVYLLAAVCVDWWSGANGPALRGLEGLLRSPEGDVDPWLSLALAQGYCEIDEPLQALGQLNGVRVTSGILAAEVDRMHNQLTVQLTAAGDRELILQALLTELDRQTGEPQLDVFFGSPQSNSTSQPSGMRTSAGLPSPSTASAVRKSSTTTTGGAVYLTRTAGLAAQSRGTAPAASAAGVPEFRTPLPITAVIDTAKEQQKLGELLRRAEIQWTRWPDQSPIGALVILARFALSDVSGATDATRRWARDFRPPQERFARPEALLVASACLRHVPSRPLGIPIARNVMERAAEVGRSGQHQSILIEWTQSLVAEGELNEAERALRQWAHWQEQAVPVTARAGARVPRNPVPATSNPRVGMSAMSTPISRNQPIDEQAQAAASRVAAAKALAGLATRLHVALLPCLVHEISMRVRRDFDRVTEPLVVVRPLRDAIKKATPDLSTASAKQMLEDLLAMLFANGPDNEPALNVPAGSDARGQAGFLGQTVLDLAANTGDLTRLRTDWDGHRLATQSTTLIALRAAAADAMNDRGASEQLIAQLGMRTSSSRFESGAPALVPITAAKRPYGPEQVLGPPDTPNPGDRATAWASSTPDGQDEWLLLEFPQAISPASVRIHENCAPGSVIKVTVFKQDGTEVDAWSGTDPTPSDRPNGVSVIPISVGFETKRVKLYIDSIDVRGWNEIDAVGLADSSGNVQWASAAAASSFYGQGSSPQGIAVSRTSASGQRAGWSTEQVLGPPNTLDSGDRPTAWASSTPDGQDEWLLLKYAHAVQPKYLKIYETHNPGAVTKVSVFGSDGTEIEAWSGSDPTPRGSPRGVSVIPLGLDQMTDQVKVYINSKDVPGWNEIDAVGLVDESGKTHWAISAAASSTYGQPLQTTMMVAGNPAGPPQATTQLIQGLRQQLDEFEAYKEKSVKKQAELEERVSQLLREVRQLREQLKSADSKADPKR